MRARLARTIHSLIELAGYRCTRLPDLSHGARPPGLDERHVSGARVLPGRDHLLPLLPVGASVAEVGVGFGDFSRRILDIVRPREFVAIDQFAIHTRPHRRRSAVLGVASHEAYYRERFRAEIDAGVMHVHRGPSDAMLDALPDGHFDFLYIDAGHAYPGVRRDIEAGHRKVRPGGLLAMDDYERGDPFGRALYGVKHAVNEFCLRANWRIVYLTLEGEAASNIVLQRPPV
jgi:SAM-dependent methyltransferase